jgi:hypothetical protein
MDHGKTFHVAKYHSPLPAPSHSNLNYTSSNSATSKKSLQEKQKDYSFKVQNKSLNIKSKDSLQSSFLRKWDSSQNIHVGLDLSTTKARSSEINYPKIHKKEKPPILGSIVSSRSLTPNETKVLPPIARSPEKCETSSEEESPIALNDSSENLLQELLKLVSDTEVLSTCSKIILKSKCGEVITLPRPVAFQSPTIQHLSASSAYKFAENGNDFHLDLIRPVLTDIAAYLLRSWFIRSNAQNIPHMDFNPKSEYLLDLLMASVYLKLPELVDIAISRIARLSESKDN